MIVHLYLRRFPPPAAYAQDDEAAAAIAQPSAPRAASKRVTPGLLEGLRLLLRHPYVLGIFMVSVLFEVIATILDYQMKVLGKQANNSTADFASFMGFFGQITNTVSLVFSIFGTSFVIRNLGLRWTLMLFPATIVVVVAVVYSAPSMWVLFGVMVSIKGLAYALNNPSKEMLYMVTTDSIKFKAKSWIDVFGGRASKALGSVITNLFKKPISALMFYGSLVSLGIALLLIAVSSALGHAFERYSASGELVGSDSHALVASAEEKGSLTAAEQAPAPAAKRETDEEAGTAAAATADPPRKN